MVDERDLSLAALCRPWCGNLGTGKVSTVLAGVVISMVPALVVVVLGQRPLREGLTAGAST